MPNTGWRKNYLSGPFFVADVHYDRNTGRQIDWSRVPDTYRQGTRYTVKMAAAAAAAATSLTVDALPVALPVGEVLNFAGAGEFAIVTAPAAVGATTVTVEALDAGIEDDDEATVLRGLSTGKVIKAGTVMCQLTSGKIVPRAVRPGSEEAMGLLMSTADEMSNTDALSGYGVIIGGVIYQALLPETITSWLTELETNGTTWVWAVYGDIREA